jgi:hypothetical protein
MKKFLSAVLLLAVASIGLQAKVKGKVLNDARIEVSADTPGTYVLIYEVASGKPLAMYAPVCTLEVDKVAYYDDLIASNIAPSGAKAIGVYDLDGNRHGSIRLSSLRSKSRKAPLYSFGVLTDVHFGVPKIDPESDFSRALDFFHAEGAQMVCICGDISEYGTEEEFTAFKERASQSKIPVYTTTGNHDCTRKGVNPEVWEQYTGHPLVFEKSVESNGRTDHFLFLGMERWNFEKPYLDEHIDWLESKLEEYKGERCFVITHLFFPERAGNLNGIYPPKNWLRGAQLERLEGMCRKYVNTMWFSGHSHWEWQLQKYQDTANVHREYEADKPASGWAVHVPGCGCPITSDGTTRVNNPPSSEGALIQVHKDHVTLIGVDLKNGRYLPIATYHLVTP